MRRSTEAMLSKVPNASLFNKPPSQRVAGLDIGSVRVLIPRDRAARKRISKQVDAVLDRRAELRDTTRLLTIEVEGLDSAGELSALEEAD